MSSTKFVITDDMIEAIKREVLFLVTTKYAVIDNNFFSLTGINIGRSIENISNSNGGNKVKKYKKKDKPVRMTKREKEESKYCGTLF